MSAEINKKENMPVHKKKQSKKRDKHRNKKIAREGITWDTLKELALSATSTIQYLDSLARLFFKNNPDEVKKTLHCQELFKGYYKLLYESSNNIFKLMRLHSVRDTENNIIRDNKGTMLLRKGKITNNMDIHSATEIFFEYVREIQALEPLAGPLLLDLAAAFNVGNKIQDIIKETSTTLSTLSSFSKDDISKSIIEYHKSLNTTLEKIQNVKEETSAQEGQ